MERKSLLIGGFVLVVVIIAAIVLIQFAAPTSPGKSSTKSATPTSTLRTPATLAPADALEAVRSHVQDGLDRLDSDTAAAAKALGPIPLDGDEARRVLKDLALASPAVIDASAVSKSGIMLTVEPTEFHSVEGSDISTQEHIRQLLSTQKPVMSRVFATVEKVNATDIEHPVFTPSGAFNGSASLLFRPSVLLTIAVEEGLAGGSTEVFVVDSDGTVMYDRDPAGVGINIYTNPRFDSYPEVRSITARMKTETTGKGQYSSTAPGSSSQVRKEIIWTTVGLHGTEWRISVISNVAAS
jgi:hypothetical protein